MESLDELDEFKEMLKEEYLEKKRLLKTHKSEILEQLAEAEKALDHLYNLLFG